HRGMMFKPGQCSIRRRESALRHGLQVDYVPGNWRRAAQPADAEQRLKDDKERAIKAVMVVHNETSTGAVSRIAEIRRAMDRVAHPALLMVDTISSLASIDYRHDEWG